MQYNLKLLSSKKEKDEKGTLDIKKEILRIGVVLLIGGLLGRVMIYLNTESIKAIAPFGIAFFMVMTTTVRNNGVKIASLIGTMFGYFTIIKYVQNSYQNIFTLALVFIYSFLVSLNRKKAKEWINFLMVLGSIFIYDYFIANYNMKFAIIVSLINTAIIIPIYYILRYSRESVEELNNNTLFSSEEIISIGILICLIICGFRNISLFEISLKDILAYGIILLFAYVGGSIYGASIGLIMGLVVGTCSGKDILIQVGFYSMLGVVAGIFKEMGKVFTSITYLLIYVALEMYMKSFNINSIIEIGIGILMFFLIPKNIFDSLEVEINMNKKRRKINELQLNELKTEFADKVKNLEMSLITVSNSLEKMNDNNVLRSKSKEEAIIGNLADRVCSKCNKSKQCWEKNFNITYNSFQELIENSENKRDIFPNHLEKICMEKLKLIRNSDILVNKVKSIEMKKEILSEGRMILSKHIKNISLSIDRMIKNFRKEIVLCEDLERLLEKNFDKNYIKYKNIFCYRDTNGRITIKITFDYREKERIDDRIISKLVNNFMNVPMSICSEGSRYNIDNNEYVIMFQETPKLQVVSYGAISVKEGEECIGDTYSFGKTKEGNYMTVISDGMGAGPQANRESSATVDIVENFFEAGFDNSTAINMVNSIMSLGFDEEEKFPTLDLNVVNLYTGEASFIKVGAVPSFIKRGRNIKKISSNMPPFGLVDELEIESQTIEVKSGDIIISVSDGVLEANKGSNEDSNWLIKFLATGVREPKQLAEDILNKAKELSDGISKDDMTVVVSKVSSVY